MKPSEIEVGDELKIRSWDDMENEFGTNDYGNIPCEGTFARCMQHICNSPFTVKEVRDVMFKRFGVMFKRFVSEEGSEGDWVISADMLEPRKADNKPEESDEDFSVRLFNLCS